MSPTPPPPPRTNIKRKGVKTIFPAKFVPLWLMSNIKLPLLGWAGSSLAKFEDKTVYVGQVWPQPVGRGWILHSISNFKLVTLDPATPFHISVSQGEKFCSYINA